jgi:uncharacterized coiled-coil protein SlyX
LIHHAPVAFDLMAGDDGLPAELESLLHLVESRMGAEVARAYQDCREVAALFDDAWDVAHGKWPAAQRQIARRALSLGSLVRPAALALLILGCNPDKAPVTTRSPDADPATRHTAGATDPSVANKRVADLERRLAETEKKLADTQKKLTLADKKLETGEKKIATAARRLRPQDRVASSPSRPAGKPASEPPPSRQTPARSSRHESGTT